MILVNGTCMTFGHGLSMDEKPWPEIIFGSDCKNIAEGGSSNQSIFRRSLEELYLNHYDVLIVAWAGLFKFEWADNYGQVKTFLLNQSDNNNRSANTIVKELVVNWHNDYWYFKQFLLMLSSLRLHCEHLGVELHCLQAGGDLAECYTKVQTDLLEFISQHLDQEFISSETVKKEQEFIARLLDETKNCWILSPTKSITEFYGQHIISPEDPHPTYQGHKLMADNLEPLFRSRLDKYTKLE